MFKPTSSAGRQVHVAGWLAAGTITLSLVAPARAHAPELPIVPGHPTGHVKHPPGSKWPPEPVGLSRVRNYSDVSEAERRRREEDTHFSRSENQLRSLPQARALSLTGRKLTRLSVETSLAKTDSAPASAAAEPLLGTSALPGAAIGGERRVHFFDRQSNQTVTVHENASGRTTVTTTPASVSQPEITAAETAEAVALARQHFAQQGVTRLQSLRGFGILAYKPTGTGFHDTRVLYVSFHVNSDAPPEYVAWVDLSRQTILSSRKEVAP